MFPITFENSSTELVKYNPPFTNYYAELTLNEEINTFCTEMFLIGWINKK